MQLIGKTSLSYYWKDGHVATYTLSAVLVLIIIALVDNQASYLPTYCT